MQITQNSHIHARSVASRLVPFRELLVIACQGMASLAVQVPRSKGTNWQPRANCLHPRQKCPYRPETRRPQILQVNKVATAPVIDQAIAGYAIAKLESLAEKIAQENGMPEKEFTRNVARLFAALMTRK